MRIIFGIVVSLTALWSQDPGDLKFSVGGKDYSTTNAQGLVQIKGDKTRIYIAVKDVASRFMLVLTADVLTGQEKQVLNLNTADSALTVSLRTRQGSFAVMPQVQFAKVDPQLAYVERVDVETGEVEDDPDDKTDDRSNRVHKRKRKKMKSEYRRVKPRWHTMHKHDRIKSGEGIIENNSFRDTYFSVQLIPVLAQGKVVSYTGTFAGSGRFAKTISGGEIKPISNGSFHVKVENVQ